MIERRIKTAVITGPTGVIGAALCEVLLQHGCTVYAVCRPNSKRRDVLPENERIHIVYCDLENYSSLPEMIPNADAFFHLAWAYTTGPLRPDMHAQISNISYSVDAVHAAARMGCKVFVGAGSQAEYGCCDQPRREDTPGFPNIPYGMAKLCAGNMCMLEAKRLGMDGIWPRILSVYGPYDSIGTVIPSVALSLLKGEEPSLTGGEQIWDFIYSSDAAEALYRIALYGRPDTAYPIGSGTGRPLKEYLVELRDMIDPQLPLGFGQRPYKDTEIMFLLADTTRLRADTGFEPAVPFSEGIKKVIEWLRKKDND